MTAATAERYLCSPHQRFTVRDITGPVHCHDATTCWAPQSELRHGRVRQPESIAEQAREEARAGP